MLLGLLFQNCGEEGFISSRSLNQYSSFEEVYPSMDESGNITAKYVKPDISFKRSYGYRQSVRRIKQVTGSLPSTVYPDTGGTYRNGNQNDYDFFNPTNPGNRNPNQGGEFGNPNNPGGDGSFSLIELINYQQPQYAGRVKNYYEGTFNTPMIIQSGKDFKDNDRELYPERYFGTPKYADNFSEIGFGLISEEIRLGSGVKTEAVAYQYAADFYREKAVIFVLKDKLFSANDQVGARAIDLNEDRIIDLAKKGYLVIHLKPKSLSSHMSGGVSRCTNIERAFAKGVVEIRNALSDFVSRAGYYGADPEKMFLIGFGEGGTLAAYTAFLDNTEAQSKFSLSLPSVPIPNGKRSFIQGVGISGGGLMDKSILHGSLQSRVVTIHGGCDETVSIDGESIYGCRKNEEGFVNPISSKNLTDFVSGYTNGSASVLYCSKSEDTSQVKSLETQMGYFAVYFHNILGAGIGSVFYDGQEFSRHYWSRNCSYGREDQTCNFDAPLISEVRRRPGYCRKGPCVPPRQDSDDDHGR
jgi:predicted esterase